MFCKDKNISFNLENWYNKDAWHPYYYPGSKYVVRFINWATIDKKTGKIFDSKGDYISNRLTKIIVQDPETSRLRMHTYYASIPFVLVDCPNKVLSVAIKDDPKDTQIRQKGDWVLVKDPNRLAYKFTVLK